MGINEKLKKLRKIKGINQEQAAAEIGVSLSSYQKYERDKNSVTPSLDVLVKLADFYNVSTDYLLGRETKESIEINLVEVVSTVANFTELEKNFFELYISLDREKRFKFLSEIAKSVSDSIKQTKSNPPTE